MPRVPLGHRASLDEELDRHAVQRVEEILASVDELQPIAWIAIDDLDLGGTGRVADSSKQDCTIGNPTPLSGASSKRRARIESVHFVRTNEREGFTPECSLLAIQLLQQQLARYAETGSRN